MLPHSRRLTCCLFFPTIRSESAIPAGCLFDQRIQHLHNNRSTYYDVLGVSRTSTVASIKAAFRTVRSKYSRCCCNSNCNMPARCICADDADVPMLLCNFVSESKGASS